jgi:YHS domain-containing protein
MRSIDSLMQRMQAEPDAGAKSKQDVRQKSIDALEARERKIAQFGRDCDRLREVWKPRLANLERTLVEDPVAKACFPMHAAAETAERGGKTFHFISADTRAVFEKRAPSKPAPAAPTPPPKAPDESSKKSGEARDAARP